MKLAKLREKPDHVRIRILFTVLVIAAAVLVTIWALTFRSARIRNERNMLREIGADVSKSFQSKVYKDTFGTPVQQ